MDRDKRPFPVCSACGWAVEISTSYGCATCGPSTEVLCLNPECAGSKEDMREVWARGPQVQFAEAGKVP